MSALSAASSRPFSVSTFHKGRVQETIHLQAKVVRNLYSILGVDCVASAKTYFRLTGQLVRRPQTYLTRSVMTRIIKRIVTNLDDTESVKVDDKIDDGVLDSAADKDEVKDDENDNKWAPGAEVYTTM